MTSIAFSPTPYYPTEQEWIQTSNLRVKMERARDARNQMYTEFGNLTYIQFYEENRKKANTILPGKKNENDVIVSAGTLENKLESVLSAVMNLNLSCEIKAFDKENNKIGLVGIALEDTIFETEEKDDDEEKKMLRQKELLIQGTVFVEERWVTRHKNKRKLDKPFDGNTKDIKISNELIKYFEGPSRRVVYGPNVYLGDITEFFMKNQPFIFTCEIINYSQAKAMFQIWDRWESVSQKLNSWNVESPNTGSTSSSMDKKWTLNNIGLDEVEMVVYQNQPEDEVQILLNGIPMLPPGFPLSAISPAGQYTIEKQVLKAIDNFAYGRGFIQSAEKAADILDEFLRLSVLKTRKSFMPSYINTSKKVISPRVLNPGTITQGITSDSLLPIGKESEGVTPSEFAMIKQLTDQIDKQTVSQQFAGQQGKSGTTATEVLELQKQAKVTLGLVIFCCAMLEKKIGYLRLYNILENWYKPIMTLNIEGQEIPKYRKTVRDTSVNGQGNGQRQVIPVGSSQDIPSEAEIRFLELEDEKNLGFPVRKIYMNPDDMKKDVKEWFIVVTPKEKDISSTNKLMFREELNDIAALVNMGSHPNVGELESEYARVWGKDKAKMFTAGPTPQQMAAMAGSGGDGNTIQPKGRPNTGGVPTLNNVKTS